MPLFPFNGRTVDVTTDRLVFQGANYLDRFVKATGASRILLVPPPSANTQIARPIMNGIEKLLGVRSGSPYLWRPHHTFTQADGCGANRPKPGYLAIILAEEGEIGSSDLWVVKE